MTHVEPLDPHIFGPDHDCFGCSPRHTFGFRLNFAREGDTVVTRFVPGPHYEGPPGIMHGGLQGTLCDEIAAWTIVGLRGKMGFTASMQLRLMRPIRTRQEVIGRGRIVRDGRRLLTIETVLEQGNVEAVKGELVFALPDESAAERILDRGLPEAWRKLCRT